MGSSREHAGATLTLVPQEAAGAQPDHGETMRKRSVVIAGHRTSVSLETAFWAGLKEIADHKAISVNRLVELIDADRVTNLSSAIRVYVLNTIRGGLSS